MQTPTADIVRTDQSEPARPGRVVSGIREAAARTGVSFDYLLAQATQESGLDPHARNAKSSASGLFQFTASTWMDMVRRHGARHGLEAEAAAIVKGANGRLDVADKAARKAILDLRKDPGLSSLMAAEYARDNARVLERRLGRAATASDLYLAHFLGAGGAARVIEGKEDNPRHSARTLLPEAARANPEIFRKATTVAGLYDKVQARFMSAMPDGADASRPALSRRVDLAAIRPLPRPETADQDAHRQSARSDTPPLPPVPPGKAMPASDTPTAQAMARVASAAAAEIGAALPAAAFATAIQPDSPFFPVAIPPAPSSVRQGPNVDSLTMRAVIQAMDSDKDV
ncbi:transglycosylase SLT domain-containing protein [Magnetospirillum sp. SS-4]|uniref:transglycosylase SLT domain-containing protein n=1 Tax=Magnetospirillum sp. SS-4 TaxID=2681465 RepID=UPI00138133AC|nr:transglycosylase SLT domain-containing protein [Magnetospirillum sp. SS-4]CAA7627462.1 conserved hypothetical protein [Magnetospirillum sp. SS-4]